jgi:hypothetical protein
MAKELGFDSWQRQETFSSPKHPDRLWGLPSLSNGYWWLFPSGKRQEMKLKTHLLLIPRLRLCGSVLPLSYTSLWHGGAGTIQLSLLMYVVWRYVFEINFFHNKKPISRFWQIYIFSAPLNMKKWFLESCLSLCMCTSLAPQSFDEFYSYTSNPPPHCIYLHGQVSN